MTESGHQVALFAGLRDINVERLRPIEPDGRTMICVELVLPGGWRTVAKNARQILLT